MSIAGGMRPCGISLSNSHKQRWARSNIGASSAWRRLGAELPASRVAITWPHDSTERAADTSAAVAVQLAKLHLRLSQPRKEAHFAADQIVKRPTGSRRNGTSYAINSRPSGSIQIP